jgi:oligopeptidase A
MNPLLDFSGLPRFGDFRPEYVTPAVDTLLAENRALVGRLVAAEVPATWDDFVAPLEDANEKLGRAWGQVGHLNAVMNSPELREVYNANLPKVTQYYSEIAQNQPLFEKFKALRDGSDFAGLTPAQRRIVENELRDFRLGGAELDREAKARFMAIRERLSQLSSRFSDNLRRTPMRITQPMRRKSPVCPRTCCRPRAKPRRPSRTKAGNSRCTRRRICRCCSTRSIGLYASACTTPT